MRSILFKQSIVTYEKPLRMAAAASLLANNLLDGQQVC